MVPRQHGCQARVSRHRVGVCARQASGHPRDRLSFRPCECAPSGIAGAVLLHLVISVPLRQLDGCVLGGVPAQPVLVVMTAWDRPKQNYYCYYDTRKCSSNPPTVLQTYSVGDLPTSAAKAQCIAPSARALAASAVSADKQSCSTAHATCQIRSSSTLPMQV
jgi:hypothetical protein